MEPKEKGRLKATEEIELLMFKHGKGPSDKTQIGALVNAKVWRRFRIHCLEAAKPAGDTLTALMELYLEGETEIENS
jgi:hypothetical protein